MRSKKDKPMRMQERISERLKAAFDPTSLEVIDDSHRHAGHGGARPGGETHYSVRLVSPAFAGKSAVQRHRLVYDALAAEIADGVHALAIDARAP
jgi:BolA protein